MTAVEWLAIALAGALGGGCGGKALAEGASSGSTGSSSGASGSSGASASGGSSSGDPQQVRFLAVLNADDRRCLPQRLVRGSNGTTPCAVIEVLGTRGDSSACHERAGLSPATAAYVEALRRTQGAALDGLPICAVAQIPEVGAGTCVGAAEAGWCYVEGGASCAQQILFSPTGNPTIGSKLWLACP